MESISAEILTHATEVSLQFRDDENILAAFVTGSITTGTYLKFSDVDIHLIFRELYKKEYAIFGRFLNGIRFDLIFDNLESAGEHLRRNFGANIRDAIVLWEKDDLVSRWKRQYSDVKKFDYLSMLRQKRSLRYKCLNLLMTAKSYLGEEDTEGATYICRRCFEEIIQIERLIRSDPNWNQAKSNIIWLKQGKNACLQNLFRDLMVFSPEQISSVIQRLAQQVDGRCTLDRWLKSSVPLN